MDIPHRRRHVCRLPARHPHSHHDPTLTASARLWTHPQHYVQHHRRTPHPPRRSSSPAWRSLRPRSPPRSSASSRPPAQSHPLPHTTNTMCSPTTGVPSTCRDRSASPTLRCLPVRYGFSQQHPTPRSKHRRAMCSVHLPLRRLTALDRSCPAKFATQLHCAALPHAQRPHQPLTIPGVVSLALPLASTVRHSEELDLDERGTDTSNAGSAFRRARINDVELTLLLYILPYPLAM
ncbi:hypothetical protein B0H10DRAFT_2229673 [Mycena sp. CBHHK59/15]|nr:hypothetical protein B0H10DRAFT_2229673 [Mycena sp. CBHHK59/15]